MRPSLNPQELEIVKFLTSEPLRSDTANHCIQIYDTLPVPDEEVVIMVMPLLREYTSPAFQTVGEAMECFRQLFEVIIVFIPHVTYLIYHWLIRASNSCIRIGLPTGESLQTFMSLID